VTGKHPFGGVIVEAWELHAGDYIKIALDDGSVVTVHITMIDRGPDHPDGGEGVDWDGVFTGPDHSVLPHGHAELGPHDKVTRVWANEAAA
jgi:hypothetical protein